MYAVVPDVLLGLALSIEVLTHFLNICNYVMQYKFFILALNVIKYNAGTNLFKLFFCYIAVTVHFILLSPCIFPNSIYFICTN
jgi:hypothetical protein